MAKNLKVCFSSKSIHWRTPEKLYKELNKEFQFDFDPCPFKTKKEDGLNKKWGKRVYCNPPHPDIYCFILKALLEIRRKNSEIVVFLLPVRSDSDWFHDLVLPNYEEIRLIRGRIKFEKDKHGKLNNAPFPSCIIIFKKKRKK